MPVYRYAGEWFVIAYRTPDNADDLLVTRHFTPKATIFRGGFRDRESARRAKRGVVRVMGLGRSNYSAGMEDDVLYRHNRPLFGGLL